MEWIENLKDNFQASDIIAVLSMIGAIIAAVFAWINKRKSAKSEAQAAQYAKNADEANQSAKRYFDGMYEHLEKQGKKQEEKEKGITQKKIITSNMYPTIKLATNDIATKSGFSEEETLKMLRELELDGIVIKHETIRNKVSWKLKG